MDYRVLMENALKGYPDRIKHTLGVRDRALELGKIYDADLEVLEVASYLHDMTKYWKTEAHQKLINNPMITDHFHEQLYHPISAAIYAKSIGVTNPVTLEAIQYHMWGKIEMALETMILCVSDYCEKNRTFSDAKVVYQMALIDLDKAYVHMLESTLKHLIEKQITPHQDQIDTYHYYLKKENKRINDNIK